jgi:hypothetical protein
MDFEKAEKNMMGRMKLPDAFEKARLEEASAAGQTRDMDLLFLGSVCELEGIDMQTLANDMANKFMRMQGDQEWCFDLAAKQGLFRVYAMRRGKEIVLGRRQDYRNQDDQAIIARLDAENPPQHNS